MWRTNQGEPPNFMRLLEVEKEDIEEDDEDEEEDGMEIEVMDITNEEDDARDRSPLRPISSRSSDSCEEALPWEFLEQPGPSIKGDVRLRMYEEDLPEMTEDSANDEFLNPDAHALYGSPVKRISNVSEKNGRRGNPGSRRQSAGRGHSTRGRTGGNQLLVGHPLNEIWPSDENVPVELVTLAKEEMRKRQREHGSRKDDGRNSYEDSGSEEDEYFDAIDGADFLSLKGQDLAFDWLPMDSFQGTEEQFQPKRTGSVRDFSSAYDAFRSYWDDSIINLIVTETNLRATKIVSRSFQNEWLPTNSHEILCLFAFWMMLGIIRMPTLVSCFSNDPLLDTSIFKRIFVRKRYELLSRALQFVDYDLPSDNKSPSNASAGEIFDRLHRLRPIIDHLNLKFQENYVLNKDICIDESITLWKGGFDFKQYVRSKAANFGIKTFELCESVTGYLWSFIVYSGRQTTQDLEQSPGVLKSTSVVKTLISPLLNKGYRLFIDSWYNSPLLARYLKRNGTDCVGTLRPTCKDVPLIVRKAPLERGEYIARQSGDVCVLAWQDTKRVTMISTCHSAVTALPRVPSRAPSRPVPFKPQVVLDYDKFVGGVASKNQMLEPYLLERKRCSQWHMKIFKRLLNVSIINARILVGSSTGKLQHHLAFRLQLVDSILANHLPLCPQSRTRTAKNNKFANLVPSSRFVDSKHWPVPMKADEGYYATQKSARKLCAACRQKKTTFACESCHVPLCIYDCFKLYHTQC